MDAVNYELRCTSGEHFEGETDDSLKQRLDTLLFLLKAKSDDVNQAASLGLAVPAIAARLLEYAEKIYVIESILLARINANEGEDTITPITADAEDDDQAFIDAISPMWEDE